MNDYTNCEIIEGTKGRDRFIGFADIYDSGRPHLPKKTIEILKNYLGNIDLIVDIGCGTGNSTEVCTEYSKKVIGIDPSEDMLAKAKEKENHKLLFNTGLENNVADLVICSQAFHWMEPKSTINEVCRILKKGGVFAVIDADTFPVIDLKIEKFNKEIQELIEKLDKKQKLEIYPTSQHLNNMIKSNKFEYCKEICFCNEILYDKEKFKKYFLSKGGLQNAIKNNYEPVISKLQHLEQLLDEVFQNETRTALFSYKIKIGIYEEENIKLNEEENWEMN